MVNRLKDQSRKEIRYTRGYQIMHRERFLECLHLLRRARWSGQRDKTTALFAELHRSLEEVGHLMQQEILAYQRLTHLTAPGNIIPDTAAPEGEAPDNLIRLVETRR
jgi:hypothetical protein